MTFLQKQIYQSMTPGQKLHLAPGLYRSARRMKETGLRRDHPDWTEKQIREKVQEVFLYAELDLFQVFIIRPNTIGVRYMITGAAAPIIYGEPRLRHDIDIVVELNRRCWQDFGEFLS